MKSTCSHSWRFLEQSPHGDDRIIKTYYCSKCPKTRTRNLKKPRYTPYAYLQDQKSTKQAKTRQKPQKSQRKPIRPVSDKRKKQNAEYSVLRKQFLEEHPICQVCCSEASNQIHHKRGRSGLWLTDISEFLAVCGDCHSWIEENRAEATKRGYLKLRLTTDRLNSHDLPNRTPTSNPGLHPAVLKQPRL
jgi:hypothetical protein